MTDYKKCKFKMPVFSLEWLILHNFENLQKINFDKNNYIKEVNFNLNFSLNFI